MTNQNLETRTDDSEITKIIGNVIEKTMTVLGGSAVGYGVDVALGGDGYIGAAAGGAGALLVSETKRYLERVSNYFANQIVKDFREKQANERKRE
jgi:hypothetical protein